MRTVQVREEFAVPFVSFSTLTLNKACDRETRRFMHTRALVVCESACDSKLPEVLFANTYYKTMLKALCGVLRFS